MTETEIREAKFAEKKRYKLYDIEGLYLIVGKKSKRWYVRYTYNGKRCDMPLGRYPFVSLLEARGAAIEVQKCCEKGEDPRGIQREIVQTVTFSEAFEKLFELDLDRFAARTMQERRWRYERYLKNSIGGKDINKITSQDVLNLLLPIHDAGLEETTKCLRNIISKVFRDGIHRYNLTFDPVQASQGLKRQRKIRHYPHIEDKPLLGRLMGDLERGRPSSMLSVRVAARLLPYLFVRPSELRHAHGKDINLGEQIWRVPTNKTRRIHIVPLADQVVAILREYMDLIGHDNYLFPSPTAKDNIISPKFLNTYLAALGYDNKTITPHGFRGTASTILNEMGYQPEWIERQLDHKEKNEVRDAYNHADYFPQRKKMMQEYADFLDELKIKYGK